MVRQRGGGPHRVEPSCDNNEVRLWQRIIAVVLAPPGSVLHSTCTPWDDVPFSSALCRYILFCNALWISGPTSPPPPRPPRPAPHSVPPPPSWPPARVAVAAEGQLRWNPTDTNRGVSAGNGTWRASRGRAGGWRRGATKRGRRAVGNAESRGVARARGYARWPLFPSMRASRGGFPTKRPTRVRGKEGARRAVTVHPRWVHARR